MYVYIKAGSLQSSYNTSTEIQRLQVQYPQELQGWLNLHSPDGSDYRVAVNIASQTGMLHNTLVPHV